jgi:cytidylate kinase
VILQAALNGSPSYATHDLIDADSCEEAEVAPLCLDFPEVMARARRIICVSHLTGAEGEAVARAVAERLGFRYLDEEIIETAAERVDLEPSVVGEVERRKSIMSRIGDAMRTDPMPRRPDTSEERRAGATAVREKPSDEDLRELIRDAIKDVADEKDIVIASHGAAMLFAGRDDTLRVLVTAPQRTRARRIAEARNLDDRRAEKLLADEDASRADYLKRFHNIERELPVHYDLVVNTEVLAPERVADLIALAANGD